MNTRLRGIVITGIIIVPFLCGAALIASGCKEDRSNVTSPAIKDYSPSPQTVDGDEIALDITPGACPNPLNPKSNGFIPMAILGNATFDVREIDVESLLLLGVPPLQTKIEDVSTPVANGSECNCTTEGPDGHDDLTLKFGTQEIVDAIGQLLFPGDSGPLTLTGTLLDGSPFEASDCIVVVGRKIKEGEFQPFGFPLSTPSHAVRLAAFGIPDWSGTEPHNGIDLIVDEGLVRTGIVSPTKGTVVSIRVSENPFSNPSNQLMLEVTIRVNSEWSVGLTIEPGTVDDQLKAEQIEAVEVEVGQSMTTGDKIADLLIGELGYPHLHYMVLRNREVTCAHMYSTESAKRLFESIPKTDDSDGYICYGEL